VKCFFVLGQGLCGRFRRRDRIFPLGAEASVDFVDELPRRQENRCLAKRIVKFIIAVCVPPPHLPAGDRRKAWGRHPLTHSDYAQ